jgi:5-methylcytosine-specific restriction endonuclease McrA
MYPGQRRRRKKQLIKRDGAKCSECRAPDQGIMPDGHAFLTIDHLIPTRLGGSNALENLRLLCYRCHRQFDGMQPGGIHPRDEYSGPERRLRERLPDSGWVGKEPR